MPRQLDPDPKVEHHHVTRVSGLLAGKFTKRFWGRTHGMTYFYGVPVGSFLIAQCDDGNLELRYRRWPIVDELAPQEEPQSGYSGRGRIRIGERRWTFCHFRLETISD